jgi:hypothetical protein
VEGRLVAACLAAALARAACAPALAQDAVGATRAAQETEAK